VVELNLDIAVLGKVAHYPIQANKTLQSGHVIWIDAAEELIV
jgi:hypothetical protein